MREDRFLLYFSSKFDIDSKALAQYLGVSVRTLYNYNLLTFDKLPAKIKNRIVGLLNRFGDYYPESSGDIIKYCEGLSQTVTERITKYVKKYNVISGAYDEREQNHIELGKKFVSKKISEDNMNILSEEITSNVKLSKGYVSNLVEILKDKLSEGNDYSFLDYISKYKKSE